MVKSYETLVDSDTKVDVNTGIVAAGRLQSLIDSRDYSHDLLVMKVQLAAICDAVKSTVPQEMWGEIIEKLDEAGAASGGARRRRRTPSMTLTTIPSTRPSSSTRTTSFDLRSARRHRGRWGPLPVWTGRSRDSCPWRPVRATPDQNGGHSPPRCPRRPDLRVAGPQGRDDDPRRDGHLRIRPDIPPAVGAAWNRARSRGHARTVRRRSSASPTTLKTLHEMPSTSSDWGHGQPDARGWHG